MNTLVASATAQRPHPTLRFASSDDHDDSQHRTTDGPVTAPYEHRFSPYVDNGGSVIAIAGKDFAVCVADTRLSTGYRIHTRQSPKFTQLTDKVIIASSGMQADIATLHKVMLHETRTYEHLHRQPPSINALSQLLSTTLYHKRFFPYYTFNVLVGLDTDGRGAIFDYDAVGSFQPSPYSARGTGSQLATSVLDNQLARTNQTVPVPELTKVQVIDLAKDVITSVAERDIYTGDSVDVIVIDASGVSMTKMPLKQD